MGLTYPEPVQALDQILCAQVGVAAKHLHGLVAGNRRHLLVAETGFDQPGDRLMAEVVEAKVDDSRGVYRLAPRWVELVRPAVAVAAGLAPEEKIRVHRPQRVLQGLAHRGERLPGEGDRSRRAVLGVAEAHDAPRQIHLVAAKGLDSPARMLL